MIENNINMLNDQIKKMLLNKNCHCKHYVYTKVLKLKIKKALDDLEKSHDNSWAVEMYLRNKDNLSKIAMNYRGHKITYGEMFSKAFDYANSLCEMGYKKEDTIPICMANIPEFVYIFLATSFIGAKADVVGEWFNEDYLASILNKTQSKYIFLSDDKYRDIQNSINKSNIENSVVFSLTDSLLSDKDGNKIDPYDEMDSIFYKLENKVNSFKETSPKKIINEKEFINLGKGIDKQVVADCTLDDICTITYTSGTTNPGCPKGCIHANRSYLTLSRFKESDVSGMPSMKNLTVLAHIPTYTYMELNCAISDTLYEKCTLGMEPFYSREFFPYSLLINKPNFVPAGIGAWVYLCKLLNYDEKWEKIDMPYLMIPTVTGEGCSMGEEKFLNLTSRKHKFGSEKLPFPLAPVTFSIGGGTTESGGIFVTLYKALQEKRLSNLIHKNTLGLTPHKFADVEVLDDNGNYCEIGEPGLLVANSPCNMIGYTSDELNKKIRVQDAFGKEWFSLGTYSYKSDAMGRIKMKGRLNSTIYTSDGKVVPQYIIEDEISKDTKNIMSVTIVKVLENCEDKYVCHIEMQPEAQKDILSTLISCAYRLSNLIPEEILNSLYFKVRTFDKSFPVAPSGKRNLDELVKEGITGECISYKEIKDEPFINEVQKILTKKN